MLVPLFVNEPPPLIGAATERSALVLITSEVPACVTTMEVLPRLPVAPPSPTCRVPALRNVPPVWNVLPVRIILPTPLFTSETVVELDALLRLPILRSPTRLF